MALLATGCTAASEPDPPTPTAAPPFAECAELTSPPARYTPPAFGNLELPCFTGEAPVRLSDLRGPAVVNLWASWCRPCREELPLMQELADRTEGELQVVGVDTGDDRAAATSFAAARNITMPTLFDQDRALQTALNRIALPVTVFLDEDGREYVHLLPIKTPAEMATLVREHTGVVVS